jgi:hypothetical protein
VGKIDLPGKIQQEQNLLEKLVREKASDKAVSRCVERIKGLYASLAARADFTRKPKSKPPKP